MSVLRSTRYNPNSVYNNMPAPGANAGPHGDAWDARPSMDSLRDGQGREGYGYGTAYGDGGYGYGGGGAGGSGGAGGHSRMESYPNDGVRYEDGYGDGGRGYGAGQEYEGYPTPGQAGYGHHGEYSGGYAQSGPAPTYPFSQQGGGYVDHPAEAHSRDAGQTPTVHNYSDGQGVGSSGGAGLRRPEEVQGHPGESVVCLSCSLG
jgi:hypothetical protein